MNFTSIRKKNEKNKPSRGLTPEHPAGRLPDRHPCLVASQVWTPFCSSWQSRAPAGNESWDCIDV